MSEQAATRTTIDSETAMDSRSNVSNIHTDVVAAHREAPAARNVNRSNGGRIIGLIFAAMVLAAILYGIYTRHHHESTLAETTAQEAVPTVAVTHAVLGSKAQELVLPGTVQAFVETPIYSRTNGYLRKWYFDIGARVKRGALLAVIETPEVDQQLSQSRAELERTEANAQLAGVTSDRWQNLLAKHAVSQQEADQAKSNYIAQQAAVDASRANVKRLEELQSYERIVAPFDGVITQRNTDIGDLISAGSGSANPRALFQLSSSGKLRIFAAVPEQYSDRVLNGGTATVTQDANPAQKITGQIVRNANAIDRTTRTLNVEVDVDERDGRLLPGAYVFVHFNLQGQGGGVTVPTNTLLFRSEGARVAVVRNNRVTLTPVEIGRDYGDTIEVISGITPADAIIVNPPDSLANGAEVRLQSGTLAAQTGGQTAR
jgi:RND family efflux transporter MFP subunit